ncbi:MAG: cellulase, partial [Dysgonamonadaceae bacterium]|nr:cellulase [Dysgonamonadaceae bacterium]
MKRICFSLLCIIYSISVWSQAGSWIRINQLGYLPESKKVAVFLSQESKSDAIFYVKDSKSGKEIFSGTGIAANAERWGLKTALRLDFTQITKDGEYYITINGEKSPVFRI